MAFYLPVCFPFSFLLFSNHHQSVLGVSIHSYSKLFTPHDIPIPSAHAHSHPCYLLTHSLTHLVTHSLCLPSSLLLSSCLGWWEFRSESVLFDIGHACAALWKQKKCLWVGISLRGVPISINISINFNFPPSHHSHSMLTAIGVQHWRLGDSDVLPFFTCGDMFRRKETRGVWCVARWTQSLPSYLSAILC